MFLIYGCENTQGKSSNSISIIKTYESIPVSIDEKLKMVNVYKYFRGHPELTLEDATRMDGYVTDIEGYSKWDRLVDFVYEKVKPEATIKEYDSFPTTYAEQNELMQDYMGEIGGYWEIIEEDDMIFTENPENKIIFEQQVQYAYEQIGKDGFKQKKYSSIPENLEDQLELYNNYRQFLGQDPECMYNAQKLNDKNEQIGYLKTLRLDFKMGDFTGENGRSRWESIILAVYNDKQFNNGSYIKIPEDIEGQINMVNAYMEYYVENPQIDLSEFNPSEYGEEYIKELLEDYRKLNRVDYIPITKEDAKLMSIPYEQMETSWEFYIHNAYERLKKQKIKRYEKIPEDFYGQAEMVNDYLYSVGSEVVSPIWFLNEEKRKGFFIADGVSYWDRIVQYCFDKLNGRESNPGIYVGERQIERSIQGSYNMEEAEKYGLPKE